MEIPQKNSGEQTAEDPEEIKIGENEKKEQEARINLIKETLEMHFPKIIGVAEFALDKKGISISDEDKEKFRNLLIGTDEVALKILEIGGLFDKRVEAISGILSPLLEKEIKIKERENAREKISQKQKIKERLRVVVPDDPEKDKEYMGKLAGLFNELGKDTGGKVGLGLVVLGGIFKDEKVQEKVSNDFREWMNENETEENVANADDGINIENIEEEIGEIVKELDLDKLDFAKEL